MGRGSGRGNAGAAVGEKRNRRRKRVLVKGVPDEKARYGGRRER